MRQVPFPAGSEFFRAKSGSFVIRSSHDTNTARIFRAANRVSAANWQFDLATAIFEASTLEDVTMKITVETTIAAAIEQVWQAWNTPDDIKQWNAASDDWHTTKSAVDLRVGGAFSYRMEAKDGTMGFDFVGTYTKVVEPKLIESALGERTLVVEFTSRPEGVTVRETFDAETTHSIEQQRDGWQAILNNFKKHVERKRGVDAALLKTSLV